MVLPEMVGGVRAFGCRAVMGGVLVLALFLGGQSAGAELPLELIKLPPGFKIDLYAEGVANARSLARSEKGTVFVGTRSEGKVYAVVDSDGDLKADQVHTIAQGLFMPNGVAFRDGHLYVAEVNRLLRFDHIEEHLADPPAPVVLNDSFPSDEVHGWKYLAFGPEGKLYLQVGSPSNICNKEEEDERYATIMRVNQDGTQPEIFARGVRNSVGCDWHPDTKELWFTDNGRDMMGDDIPPDELNRAAKAGLHFGYPYCHGNAIADPAFNAGRDCAEFEKPARELGPHVAALGLKFYTGSQFPEEYRKQLFIAEHGSYNRSPQAGTTGYRIALIRLDNAGQVSAYEDFATGWMQADKAWGRPVDLLNLPDGSFLVSDDHAGAIYRISWAG